MVYGEYCGRLIVGDGCTMDDAADEVDEAWG